MSSIGQETELWRTALQRRGFGDDGEVLQGPVRWTSPAHGRVTAQVQIALEGFPFAPPTCRLIDPGANLKPTFHLDRPRDDGRSGSMCLWDDEHPVDQAPWRDPDRFLERVSGWLTNAAQGWPGDTSTDLERYLPADAGPLVLYDAEELASLTSVAVRTEHLSAVSVRVTAEVRHNPSPRTPRRRHRKDQELTWLADLGEISAPVTSWADLDASLSPQDAVVRKHLVAGVVERLLLRYTHGGFGGVLVVRLRRVDGRRLLAACESADSNPATRQLRAGVTQQEARDLRVAVVGCGAVGSYIADLLFRSGVRRMTLIDHEVLRPGNVVRHLAGTHDVGRFKVHAVRDVLAARGEDVTGVKASCIGLNDLVRAEQLVQDHDVVVDATASARASSLLATAAEGAGRRTGHYVVSVCTQRAGGVVRADRLPLRRGELHLPPLERQVGEIELREQGCGSPVAVSPPGAVVHAAELATRMVLDAGTRELAVPATLMDVREPQDEPPYDRAGLVSSADTARAAGPQAEPAQSVRGRDESAARR